MKFNIKYINPRGKISQNGPLPTKTYLRIILAAIFFTFVGVGNGQTPTSPNLLQIADRYWMQPDVAYNTASNTTLKLDIWYPRDNAQPTPTLVYIHGGGWIFGSKEGAVYQFLPF